jgi:hypothetical protein
LRRIILGIAIVLGAGLLINATLTRIDAGYVGIR